MLKGYVEPNDSRYQRWIDKHAPKNGRQACKSTSIEMVKAFPELRVVGVSYFDNTGHAWCVNAANEVIDPTAHQFNGPFNYNCNRLELSDFPIGRCPWCGETMWHDTPGVRAYLDAIGDDYTIVGPHVECRNAFFEESMK